MAITVHTDHRNEGLTCTLSGTTDAVVLRRLLQDLDEIPDPGETMVVDLSDLSLVERGPQRPADRLTRHEPVRPLRSLVILCDDPELDATVSRWSCEPTDGRHAVGSGPVDATRFGF
jgi:hypothetical protein